MAQRRLDPDEMERAAGIQRDSERTPTQRDVEELERKKLGPFWGRPRRRLEGWPRGRS